MTLGQIMLVTFFGVLLAEAVAVPHALRLLLGMATMYLILT